MSVRRETEGVVMSSHAKLKNDTVSPKPDQLGELRGGGRRGGEGRGGDTIRHAKRAMVGRH